MESYSESLAVSAGAPEVVLKTSSCHSNDYKATESGESSTCFVISSLNKFISRPFSLTFSVIVTSAGGRVSVKEEVPSSAEQNSLVVCTLRGHLDLMNQDSPFWKVHTA